MRCALLAVVAAAQAARCGGAFTCGPADDAATCSALGDLYAQGLQPPPSTGTASGWAAAAAGVPTNLCSFNGSSCDGAGNLVSIVLRNGLLGGSIPPSLGNVSTLQLLDLGGNLFNGTIPAELGRLGALTALLLDGNFLSGPLPALPQSLTLLRVEDNELAGSGTAVQPAAACTAACASTAAFACPATFGGSCAGACAAPAGCRPACPVPPPTAAAVVASALAPYCAGAETSCFQCAAAMFSFFMSASVPANMSAAQLGSCLHAQLLPFLAAGASSVAVSSFRACALPRRLSLPNSTCTVRPTTAAWAAAKMPCALQTEVCNSCSAVLVDVLRAAGLAVPPLGLAFTSAHYELVANCLAQRALDIVAAGVDAVNLALGFSVCSGPSTAWYTWLANNSAALLYPAAAAAPAKPRESNAAALGGGLGGGLGGAALAAVALLLLLRRHRRASADAARAKDAPPPATCLLRRDELMLYEPLGVGGFATVYRADWHGAPVAVKCFEDALVAFSTISRTPSGSADSASATSAASREPDEASLLRELRVLSALRHPNICAVYGAVARPPMLVIELAPAGSLAVLLRSSTQASLPWRARLHIGAGVACGTEFLNSQTPCIIHGDLKSANVVLSAEMVPKLCDFGLARVLPALRDDSAREAIEGTARYMAPELALGHPITLPKAIDCYGLGMVLHDLAHVGLHPAGDAAASAANSGAGRTPASHTVSVLFARNKQGFVVPISPECPPPLAALLQRCLAVEPTERPESGAVRLSLLEMETQADSW